MMRSNPWFSFSDHPLAARRMVDTLFGLYYVGLMVSASLTFLGEPSPAVENALQTVGTEVWSIGTIGAALVALVCRTRRFAEAETVALAVLAVLTVLHGAMIMVGSPGTQGFQTGLRLMFASTMMLAVVGMLRHPTMRVPRATRTDR